MDNGSEQTFLLFGSLNLIIISSKDSWQLIIRILVSAINFHRSVEQDSFVMAPLRTEDVNVDQVTEEARLI